MAKFKKKLLRYFLSPQVQHHFYLLVRSPEQKLLYNHVTHDKPGLIFKGGGGKTQRNFKLPRYQQRI